tara:strand:- start:683 stop:2014 length:1332 start_codon:yes stop_codon:yes gene_type:complete
MSKIKTRFAPSPTGYLHIGGARTALFAWLYAKANQGECLLRIEDTDKARSKDEYTEEIINSFRWLGITFDQETIFQSNNEERYQEMVDQLIENGSAYVCKGDDIEEDKKSRDLNLAKAEDTVVRFKMPEQGSTSFTDLVKGEIQVSNDQLEDFIIERSDGTATYNFCVVVDDMDSEITHVIRGDDHVNNTFKQINVFKAFKENVPTYGHVPMILGEDGKRLSKRHGALGVGEYSAQGILPEALKNYLLRLGWAKGDQEIFDHQTMEEIFLDGTLNQSPATFSMDKLLWFNRHYLDSMSDEQLTKEINIKEFDGGEYSNNVLMAIRDRCSTLNDFVVHSSYFFNDPEIFEDTLIKKHCKEETHGYLLTFKSHLSELEKWDQISIKETIEKTIAELDVGFGKIGLPLRLALTATVNSPSIDLVCEILGKDIVLKRLENFLTMIQS